MVNSNKKKILFLCTGNSCRSQMGEGLARHFLGDRYDAYSAGVETHGLNPNAVKVMGEIGIDISAQQSQNISEFMDMEFDVVLTVCENAKDRCPNFPKSVKIIHHSFDDPPALAKKASSEEDALGYYRRVRDEIKEFLLEIA